MWVQKWALLSECCPHRTTEPHCEKQFSPVPKVSDDVQNYPPWGNFEPTMSSVRDQRKFQAKKCELLFTRCDKKSSYSKPEFCDLMVWWFGGLVNRWHEKFTLCNRCVLCTCLKKNSRTVQWLHSVQTWSWLFWFVQMSKWRHLKIGSFKT